MRPLTTSVAQELAISGDLLFTLLGKVKGMRPQTQKIDGRKVQQLCLIPSLTGMDLQRTGDGIYSMRRVLPIEELLEFVHEDLKGQGGISPEDRRVIGSAYDKRLRCEL